MSENNGVPKSNQDEKVWDREKDAARFENGEMLNSEANYFFAWLIRSGELVNFSPTERLYRYLDTAAMAVSQGFIGAGGEVLKEAINL